MKKLRVICLTLLGFFTIGYVVAECIGNTTHVCYQSTVYVGEMDPFQVDQWCCVAVGNGSDYSCTDGQSWMLASDLSCDPIPL